MNSSMNMAQVKSVKRLADQLSIKEIWITKRNLYPKIINNDEDVI